MTRLFSAPSHDRINRRLREPRGLWRQRFGVPVDGGRRFPGRRFAGVRCLGTRPLGLGTLGCRTSTIVCGRVAAGVSASHADPALEALLPAEISGTPMQRSSATLAALVAAGANRTAIDGFLQGIGKSESDGTYAAAFDPANAVGGGIFAFKVAGVDAGVLLPAILAVEQSDLGAGATTRKANVGGKDVTVVSVGTGVNDTEWVYARDGVVFVIHAPDEAHAAAYLQALS